MRDAKFIVTCLLFGIAMYFAIDWFVNDTVRMLKESGIIVG